MNKPSDAYVVALAETPHSSALSQCLIELGLTVLPFAKNSESAGALPLERWIVQLIEGEFDDVIFTSAQGVHLMVEVARQLEKGDAFLDALAISRKVTRGSKPASALSELGLSADLVSKGQDSQSLLNTLSGLSWEGRTVGIQPFDRGPELMLARLIEQKGGTARLVAPSTTVDPEATILLEQMRESRINAVVFLTERTAAWMFDACRVSGVEERLVQTLRQLPVVAAEAACHFLRRRGVHPDLVLSHATVMQPVARDMQSAFGLLPETARKNSHIVPSKHRIVIVGNGMVSYKLCERLTEDREDSKFRITVLGEERWPAYDRVRLSAYFSGSSVSDLILREASWYESRGVELRLGQRAAKIDRGMRVVLTNSGEEVPYDTLVLATGAAPFVPPVPGLDKAGVFVYRTIEDLEAITAFAQNARSAAIIGGGLLGLEAAKAAYDLGLETHVVEQAPRLMPRQLDEAGSRLLRAQVERMGISVHLGRRTTGVLGSQGATGLRFFDGSRLDVDMIIVSAGIRPRDELAKEAGIETAERGGVIVNDRLGSSDPDVYAVGECASHQGTVYGLVAPGYEMASTLAKNLLGGEASFATVDMSTKLKLLGVEVASLGDPFADDQPDHRTVVYQDLVKGIYKKVITDPTGKFLVGAILVGDTSDYATLLPLIKGKVELPVSPDELLFGNRGESARPLFALSDESEVCSCNGVSRGDVLKVIRENDGCTLDTLKKCSKAGTGCGGCVPLVADMLAAELRAAGKTVSAAVCEHFEHSRQELYALVKLKGHRSFHEVLGAHGKGHGCEVCKPMIASILASVHAEPITDHATIQDTNDRFLANIQKGGLYSVVPRIPAGEITPDKLLVIGQVAKKYGLYTKITGGQRIDLFGARVDQLPDIWEELVRAGFESGHAYGKALRTVKSCVGSTWCRYGVQDSVGFAVRVEERYKGLRSPHKLKSAVSGCVRECAEARSKDFGLIATEKGYNLYVCGNGGAKPRHADLLATDLDEETALRYLDRFLMYYIKTADRLMRTSTWLDKLEGGIEHLKQVVVHDSLKMAAEWESDMQKLVDRFACEWRDVVENPEKRAQFTHFGGSERTPSPVGMVVARGQRHPEPWPSRPIEQRRRLPVLDRKWVQLLSVMEVPRDGGIAVRYGRTQLAVFHYAATDQYYVTQNLCPHKREMVLARGLLGDQSGVPKVACPLHKKSFHLEDGSCLSGDEMSIMTFPAKVQAGFVVAELPSELELQTIFEESACESNCSVAAE